MRHSVQKKTKTLQIAGLFIIIVIVLVGLALLIKLVILFSKSTFDSTHQYVLQMIHGSDKSSIVIFDPDTHSISLIRIKGDQANKPVSLTLQIPTDAVGRQESDETQPQDDIHHLLFAPNSTINSIDKIKLLLFAQTVASEDIHTTQIILPLDSQQSNSFLPLLQDESLYKEAASIAIINGSGIVGLGSTTAALLEHIGANVISVTTADQNMTTSSLVYTGEKTYTVKRLEKIFSLPAQKIDGVRIATITLTLGSNAKGKLKNI